MNVDLHCHTTASDGELTPAELLSRAAEQGVDMLAITDHDSMDGYLSIVDQRNLPVDLVAGVELSCVWAKTLVHIVGLNIDPQNTLMLEGLASQQRARAARAEMIAAKLEKYGFKGAYDYAFNLAGGGQIGRPHFAQFLLDRGHVPSLKQAYKKYLGAGKPGDVKLTWPAMATVVDWVNKSSGVAVIAHPLHYKMTATKLRALLADFKHAGGAGLEVVSGKQPADRTRYLAGLADQFELLASIGSDFHKPGMAWNELGQMGQLPGSCRGVWTAWQ